MRRQLRIRNEEIHRMPGASKDITMRMKKDVLSWFGHIERMNDERMAKKIHDGKMSGKRDRGKPPPLSKILEEQN